MIASNHPNVGEVMLMGHWVQDSGTLFTIPTQLALYNTLILLFDTNETALQGRRGKGSGGGGGGATNARNKQTSPAACHAMA